MSYYRLSYVHICMLFRAHFPPRIYSGPVKDDMCQKRGKAYVFSSLTLDTHTITDTAECKFNFAV